MQTNSGTYSKEIPYAHVLDSEIKTYVLTCTVITHFRYVCLCIDLEVSYAPYHSPFYVTETR